MDTAERQRPAETRSLPRAMAANLKWTPASYYLLSGFLLLLFLIGYVW